jgi:hypothetical protein
MAKLHYADASSSAQRLPRLVQTEAHLPVAIKLVGRYAVKSALLIPRQPRKPMHCPAETNGVIIFLPNPLHFHVQLLEKQVAVKSEAPKYEFVVVQTIERIPGITECYIVSENVICTEATLVSTTKVSADSSTRACWGI